MHQNQAEVGVSQANLGKKQVGANAHHHNRHHHRGDQQTHQRTLAKKLDTGQADGRQGAQYRGQQGGQRRDDEAVAGSPAPFVGAEQIVVPLQRPARHRVRQKRAGTERQRHDDQNRQQQKQQNAKTQHTQGVPAHLVSQRGVGGEGG